MRQAAKPTKRNPWAWIPTLYFAEGLPYVIVMTVSVIMYKRLGISNTDIALYTSWLYLPWVIKPLWSPVVDVLRTKRWWIVIMQLLVGAGLAGVALTIPMPNFFRYSLAFLWLVAFSSATHDIAADGFYMMGLNQYEQTYFVGIRNTFYRFAMLTGQGLLVILAGYLETATGLPETDIAFHSAPGKQTTLQFQPNDISFPGTKSTDYVLVPSSKNIEIGTNPVSREKADSIFTEVKEWNISHGFYTEETSLKGMPDGTKGKTSGFALVAYKLNKPPKDEKEVVLNFGRDKGNKSFHLKEGARFVFNADNWDEPAFAIVQIDPKLTEKAEATFSGRAGNIPLAWSLTFMVLGGLFVLFFIWHRFVLPRPAEDTDKHERTSLRRVIQEVLETFASFFRKKNIGSGLAFLLLFRLGESQLVKLTSPFMLDDRTEGGLALTTGDIGLIYGTIGMVALTVGGILGGFVAARWGLKKTIWWMAVAMNLPNLVYVYLAYVQPDTMLPIVTSVGIEQFGYGFGFTAYMLYMIYISDGKHKTAHYALCTGFMALGMMLPGMASGWIQETVGYQHFFVWVMLCTIPGFILISLLKIDPKFGTKTKA
ncbi:MFS transporter [Prolixibacter sp. SD074]|uniref:MFS transporter n=1 Tax=Prolixibacter sp. SD074 TaxID=2652391 RepID=UPI00127BCE5B|nr:MFS transporter [Prolixibacter sp. SD074]GET30116.1 hypothetical protein SD074_23180 [Prolixibacter sp. SD074]